MYLPRKKEKLTLLFKIWVSPSWRVPPPFHHHLSSLPLVWWLSPIQWRFMLQCKSPLTMLTSTNRSSMFLSYRLLTPTDGSKWFVHEIWSPPEPPPSEHMKFLRPYVSYPVMASFIVFVLIRLMFFLFVLFCGVCVCVCVCCSYI